MTRRDAVDLCRFDTPDGLSRAAADIVLREGRSAVDARGRFMLALSGGSTPRRLYRLLAEDEGLRAAMPWRDAHVFWGDERHVPPTHADSNYLMAWETLLRHVPVEPRNVHRVVAEDPDAASAAAAYEMTLREAFGTPEGGVPAFDLMLLGMGADGHTASLFPRSPALAERERLVVSVQIEKLNAMRVTMTPAVLLAARRSVVLVAGADKALALRDAVHGPLDPARLPAQLLRRATGTVTWLVDEGAARELR